MTISSTPTIRNVIVGARTVDCQLYIPKSTTSGTPCFVDVRFHLTSDIHSMVVEELKSVLNGQTRKLASKPSLRRLVRDLLRTIPWTVSIRMGTTNLFTPRLANA